MSDDLKPDQIRLVGRESNLIFDVHEHTGQSKLEYLTNFPHASIFAFETNANKCHHRLRDSIIANDLAFTR
jgi:hypothetical protein